MAATTSDEVDSRWSWVILFFSAVIIFLFTFLSSSVAIIQVEIIEDFQVGSGVISIMTAMSLGTAQLLGPISGIMASLFSIRYTIFIGVSLMSVGMLSASFCQSIVLLIFCFGALTGIGFGITFSPVMVIISLYFEKRRMLANGILQSASGLGPLSLPYLHRYLIDTNGWRFTFALYGAIMLHAIVCAAFFFPTEIEKSTMLKGNCCCWRTGDASLNGSDAGDEEINVEDTREDDTEAAAKEEESKEPESKSVVCLEKNVSGKCDSFLKQMIGSNQSFGSKSLNFSGSERIMKPYIPIYINGTPEMKRIMLPQVSNLIVSESPSMRHSLTLDETNKDGGSLSAFKSTFVSEISFQSALSVDNKQTLATPSPSVQRRYKFGQLRKYQSRSRSMLGSGFGWASTELGSSILLPINIEEIREAEEKEQHISLKERMVSLVKNKDIWLIGLNNLLFMCGCGLNSVHLPTWAKSMGIGPDDISMFFTVYGSCLMCARLFGGIVYNKLNPPLLLLQFFLQMFNGLVLFFAPFYATSFTGIMVEQMGIGIMYGQAYMLMAPMTAEIMGVENLALAFGITQLFNGVGYILFPIFAGFIYDTTGSFDIPFHVGGILVMTAGCIALLLQFLKSKDAKSDCMAKEADERTKALIHDKEQV